MVQNPLENVPLVDLKGILQQGTFYRTCRIGSFVFKVRGFTEDETLEFLDLVTLLDEREFKVYYAKRVLEEVWVQSQSITKEAFMQIADEFPMSLWFAIYETALKMAGFADRVMRYTIRAEPLPYYVEILTAGNRLLPQNDTVFHAQLRKRGEFERVKKDQEFSWFLAKFVGGIWDPKYIKQIEASEQRGKKEEVVNTQKQQDKDNFEKGVKAFIGPAAAAGATSVLNGEAQTTIVRPSSPFIGHGVKVLKENYESKDEERLYKMIAHASFYENIPDRDLDPHDLEMKRHYVKEKKLLMMILGRKERIVSREVAMEIMIPDDPYGHIKKQAKDIPVFKAKKRQIKPRAR